MTFAQATGQHRAPSVLSSLTGGVGGGPDRNGQDRKASRTRRWSIIVWLVAFVVLVLNERGQIFFDTKLGVDIDPLGFYARLWHLWNPTQWFGTLQDQYIGYAFPMAPFYLAGQLLKVPIWVTERFWLSLLVAAGFAGLVKLAEAVRIGTDRSRVVAGLAFVLWPTFTILIGSTSAGILPGLLAPWAVLPLVSAANGGSLARAAARSGVAVLFMGGVNATSTLYVLILPALFIATQLHSRRRIMLAGLWAGAVALSTAWWVVPLLLQGKYSYNFLPYVEQSATTAGTMSAASFLRGAGNWTAYLNLGQPWLRAGWVMVAYPVAILAAAIAAGTGLLGLSRRDLPAGGWLRLSLGAAALIALCGYPGPLGGLFHQPIDQLLNGVASPLRSVYKVEPVAAAVLALGIAHALVLRVRRAALVADPASRTLWHLFAAPVIGLVLLGLAYPQVSGQVLNAGSYPAVPTYWYQVAAFLKQHSPRAPALVVPAAAHGVFVWGEPVDDPLEPLASSPWVAQGLVPYGGAGSELLLRSVQGAINSGERIAGLAATLHRSGIGFVVVRNDLSPAAIGYTPPQVVHQSLVSSGFRLVASFGPAVSGAVTNPAAPAGKYSPPAYPAVEIFAAGPATLGPPPPAVALAVNKTVLVNGGPDALLQLTGQRILAPSAPAVIAGDRPPARAALWAITDSLRRADNDFGLIDPTASYTYTATETNPTDDPLGNPGGPPRQLLPAGSAGHQTVAVLTGAAAVTASSSGSWLAETPQIDPVNAFDGNPNTFWAEANPTTAVGQWVQIAFDHRIAMPRSISIRLLDDFAARPVPSRLTVSTDAGTVTSSLRRTGAAQPLKVPPGLTRTLRITIAAVRGGVPGGSGAGFADVAIPGVMVTRYLKLSQARAGEMAATAFSFEQQVPSPASLANVAAYPPLARTFTTPGQGSFRLGASAIAVPGSAFDAVLTSLTPVRGNTLEVTASSTYGSLPGLAPANLFRLDHPGPWIAGGQHATLRLSWPGTRTIRQLVLQPLPGLSAAPEAVKITSPQGIRNASVGLGGLTQIVPPLTTSQMTISFPVVQFATTVQPISGQLVRLPVGLSKLSIPALRGLQPATLAPDAKFALPCGSGPAVTLDGQVLRTRVFGKIGGLIAFQPVHVRLCRKSSQVQLAAGRHWLAGARPGAFTITGLSLISVGSAGQAAAGGSGAQALQDQAGQHAPAAGSGHPARSTKVLVWDAEYRQVRIARGPASYLELHQNANPGWSATLRGKELTPITLDGWQQGFIIPAGTGGVVSLTFGPVKFYHVWIILSAAGVLGLFLAAIAGRRRRSVREQMERESPAGIAPGADWSVWLGLVALAVLIAIVAGPMVLAVPVVALLAYRWPGWYGGLAAAAMVAAGVFTSLAAHPALPGTGAFGAPAQACAILALCCGLMPVLPERRAGAGGAGGFGDRS
ncbi:MAG TPA: alpha-(1-_3)-arabinofuranosyltransferase family protein [Streptosporangiaceae bacterium]